MERERDDLLLKLGAAKHQFRAAWPLVKIEVSQADGQGSPARLNFQLLKDKLRVRRRREGRYLLRSNLSADDPGRLWPHYIQLTQVEAAFKDLKDDLKLRPLFHQLESRIEAHIFVAFLAYCLLVSLRAKLCGTSLPPSKCWTCISRPPTEENWYSADPRNRKKTKRCCWRS